MIGLIFFGAIALWMLLALNLGRKIPQWFKLKPEWSWLFVPLVFFMPVMDEVIALPQAYVLCKQAEDAFWYDTNVGGQLIKKGLNVLDVQQRNVGLNIPAQIPMSSIKAMVQTLSATKTGPPETMTTVQRATAMPSRFICFQTLSAP